MSFSLVGTLEAVVLVVYDVSLLLLFLFGLRRLYIVVQYYRLRREVPLPAVTGELPMVTVQLPVFNEVYVVERLLASVTALDYPRDRLEIQVLDDSTDETTELLARLTAGYRERGHAIQLLHRAHRGGYKAGALAAGMASARGELVAIFDADFLPPRDFLHRTVPHFADARLAFVQGGWLHLNRERSLLTRVQAILLDAHFRFEHTVRSLSGYFVNFTGTGGVWRAAAIEDAGGWQHDTLIEDADIAYRAQIRGWRALHLPDLLVPSELPEEPSAWRTQQQRWAKGSAQVLRKLMLPIARSAASPGAKLECFLHLTSNCAHPLNLALASLLIPAMWIRVGAPSHRLIAVDGLVFAVNMLSVGSYFALAQRERPDAPRWWRELRVIPSLLAIGVGSSLSQARAFAGGLFGHDVVFQRTPKPDHTRRARQHGSSSYRAPVSRLVLVEVAFAGAYAAAIVAAVWLGKYAMIPFLLLFFHGFSHVAAISLWEILGPRLSPPAPAALDAGESASR